MSKRLTLRGETKSVRAWADDARCPVSAQTVYDRLSAGVPPEDAVFGEAARGAKPVRGRPSERVYASTKGAQRLLDWCEAQGTDLHEVSCALQVSYSTVLNLINGKSVSYSMAFKAAVLAGMEPIGLAADFGLGTEFFLPGRKRRKKE